MNHTQSSSPLKPTIAIRSAFRQKLWYVDDLDADIVDRIWNCPDSLIDDGEMLKDGDRSTVVKLKSKGTPLTMKRYNAMSVGHSIIHGFMRSRSTWSWLNGHRVIACGLNTPKPMACLEIRFGPLKGRSFFVCEYVEGEILLDLVRDGDVDNGRLNTLAKPMKAIWHTLGQQKLHHGDMKATNFIVGQDDSLWMLDLDGMRKPLLDAWYKRQRAKDRARFMKNWRGLGECEAVFLACVDTA